MIKHYLEVHEYINKHIYRLPVSEYQIITEGFGWGMLAGLGIAGLIAIAWKLIDEHFNISGSSSKSSSSSDDDKRGPFNLRNVKAFLNTEHSYVMKDSNLYKYIQDKKDTITDEKSYLIVYNSINVFGEAYELVFKIVALILAKYKYDEMNDIPSLSELYPKIDNKPVLMDQINIERFNKEQFLDNYFKQLQSLNIANKYNGSLNDDIKTDIKFDNLKTSLEEAEKKIREKLESNAAAEYEDNIKNFNIEFIRYTVFLHQLDTMAYRKKSDIDSILAEYIEKCRTGAEEKYQPANVRKLIINAIMRDGSGDYVETIKTQIKEEKNEDSLYDKKLSTDINELMTRYRDEILNKETKTLDLNTIEKAKDDFKNKLGNGQAFDADTITFLAQLVKKYWDKKEEGSK